MTVYFESRNNDGIMQIKDDAQLMFLVDKHKLGEHKIDIADTTWNITVDGESKNYQVYGYSITPENDKIFCIGNPTVSPVLLFHRLTSTWKWSNYWRNFAEMEPAHLIVVANTTETQADSLDVYVFKKGTPAPSKYGLQCYDADGRLSYDAASKPLKILDGFFQTNISAGGTNYGYVEKNYSYEDKSIAVSPFTAYHDGNGNTAVAKLTSESADFKQVKIVAQNTNTESQLPIAFIGILNGFGFGAPYAILYNQDYHDYWTTSMYTSMFVVDVTNY